MHPLSKAGAVRDDRNFLQRAVDAAIVSIPRGGGPFGAIVVTSDGQVYEGTDTVLTTNDSTAHAEMNAIRAASQGQENYDLSGSVLYSSSEPCPMCLTAALWARIDRIVYAATADRAAASGFDDASFYRQLKRGVDSVSDAAIEHLRLPTANEPFDSWDSYEGRIDFWSGASRHDLRTNAR